MNDTAMNYDHESFELANTRLKLRHGGMEFMLHESRGEVSYLVRDGVTHHYHQIGVAQYALMSAIDGKRTLAEITRQIATEVPSLAITSSQSEHAARYLLDSQLVVAVDAQGQPVAVTGRMKSYADKAARQKTAENANPLFLKFPLGDPGPLLDRFAPKLTWIFSPGCFAVMAVFAFFAIALLWQNTADVIASLQGILSTDAAIGLLVSFVGLKIVHELGHAIACYRYGGRVRETGIVFILFLPIAYVDVTSAWGFRSRGQRMMVSAAGMIVEMMFSVAAVIAWSFCTDPIVRFHLWNLVMMGTVTTLLFNANFLMRFDGYFFLSDALGIPNLAALAKQCVSARAKQIFMGVTPNLADDVLPHQRLLTVYGVAAMVWRILVCVALTIAASKLFYGFGVVLAIVSVLVWVGRPVVAMVRYLASDRVEAIRSRRTLLCRTLPMSAVLFGLTFVVAWPGSVSAPAMVRHREPEIVRAETDGFIREILVTDGQRIETGALIARLDNHELETQIIVLQSQLAASRVRARQQWSEQHIAAHDAETAVADSLQTRLDELNERRGQWRMVATTSGRILLTATDVDEPSELIGRYARSGTELFQIVDPSRKELLVSVSQDDTSIFHANSNQEIRFIPTIATSTIRATLTSVSPQATTKTDPRLTVAGGGPLALRVTASDHELIQPRLEAVIELDSHSALATEDGMTGTVRLADQPRSIAAYLWAKWIQPQR